ncbi:MAG: RNA polymerase factor sigma-54 [Phycisphaera sp.]|nr:RNA polymerase factor sigma-54 [Phycisphaera sp.]
MSTVRRGRPASQDADGVVSREVRLGWKPKQMTVAFASSDGARAVSVMRFDTRQQVKLGQQMKLAPRMIQSMEILQLPLPLLQERVEQELESNVALELAEPGEGASDAGEQPIEVADTEREFIAGETGEDFQRLADLENRYRDVWDGGDDARRPAPSGDRDAKLDAMANTADRGRSLASQLDDQWRLAEVPENVNACGRRLIEYVDDDGYLGADLETIQEQGVELEIEDWTPSLLERTLDRLQRLLEPPGLLARTRQECLLLQIDAIVELEGDEDGSWTDAAVLIGEHFDDLVQNRLPKVAKDAEMSLDRVQEAKVRMHRLTLWPGRELANPDVQFVMPDVIVEYEPESDQYVAALANGTMPVLRINPQVERMRDEPGLDTEGKAFIDGAVRDASWLIDAVNQRTNTLLRVVRVVLERQREFFDHGPQFLKPLPMTEVADRLGVHVATVSRAVSEKWMQTPRGIYPLRRFFSGGREAGAEGEEKSWEAIKAMLQEIVDAEDKAKPLSDQKLADGLKEKGVEIARRTVVKYREQLGIPPARRRKIHA